MTALATQLDLLTHVEPSRSVCALVARDQALDRLNETADETDVEVCDRIIGFLRDTRQQWSANDCRTLLPVLRSAHTLSARLNSWRMRGLIEVVGEVTSTDPGTHAKPVKVYRRATR